MLCKGSEEKLPVGLMAHIAENSLLRIDSLSTYWSGQTWKVGVMLSKLALLGHALDPGMHRDSPMDKSKGLVKFHVWTEKSVQEGVGVEDLGQRI